MKILIFIVCVLTALVMGVLWGTWLSLSRSIEEFSAATFLEIGKKMIHNLAWPMRMLMPLTMLSTLALCVWLALDGLLFALTFTGAALLLLIAMIITTLTVNVPIDYKIKDWTPDSLPATWEALRRRWELFHAIRTALAVGAFCSLMVAALII